MKAVILAGGLGTRISEETHLRPKPLIDIGHQPILWHIMKIYAHYGINEFIIALGYKGHMIKDFFLNYHAHQNDVSVDLSSGEAHIYHNSAENWKVHLIDTGQTTMTGGRLKRLSSFFAEDETFCLTYGDGLANINIDELIKFHHQHGKLATLSAIMPTQRFGILDIDKHNHITNFSEKKHVDETYINGGFFVLSQKVLSYIQDDETSFEREPLEKLSQNRELVAYKHDDFWYCMDSLRDKTVLENLWNNNIAPWKVW